MREGTGDHRRRTWMGGAAKGLAWVVCLAAGACGQPGSGDVPAKDVPASAAGAASGTAAAAMTAAASAPDATASAPQAGGPSAAAPAESNTGSASAVTSAGAAASPTAARSAAASASPDPSAAPSASASAEASAPASAAASAAPEPALTVQSAKTQEASFAVWMQSAKSYKVGEAGSVEVVLVPKGDYHCNAQYPYKVKMGSAPAGVSYSQDVVRGASVSPARTSIRVPFTATAAGDARISGKFHFSICTADQCVIDSREVAATVKIE